MDGIPTDEFHNTFLTSGILSNTNIRWIVFHGLYDFAYLLKILRNDTMPATLSAFYTELDRFFPKRVDLKFHRPQGSLSRLATEYYVDRMGGAHQWQRCARHIEPFHQNG